MSPILCLLALAADRFTGATIEYHRSSQAQCRTPSDWPEPYRARLVTSKNERAEYRITRYAATAEGAAQAVLDEVARLDGEPP